MLRERAQRPTSDGKLCEHDRLVDDLLCWGAKVVIVDLPATSITRLREISADYDFVAATKSAGYRLTVVSPIMQYDDSILDLQETIALFDPKPLGHVQRPRSRE